MRGKKASSEVLSRTAHEAVRGQRACVPDSKGFAPTRRDVSPRTSAKLTSLAEPTVDGGGIRLFVSREVVIRVVSGEF